MTSYVVRQIALLAYLEESLVNVALLLSQERILVLSVHNLSMLLQSAWNPYTKRNINKIEMVQRRAARFVFNDYSRASHVSPMIDHLGWDNLQQRRLLHQATMFYKIHQGLVGISLPDDVCPLTRASRLPNICPFRQIQSCVNVYKFSFYPRTIVTWNHIPFNNLCQSTPSFKTLAMPSIKSLNVAN